MVEKQRINHTDSNFSCILLLLGWMNYGNFVQKSQGKVDTTTTTGAYFQNMSFQISLLFRDTGTDFCQTRTIVNK